MLKDQSLLLEVIEKVIRDNPNSLDDYKKGQKKVIGFLVGQAMKATKVKPIPKSLTKSL